MSQIVLPTAVGVTFGRLRAAMIDAGAYIDPISRERDRYVAGLIEIDEFERRVERLLAGKPAVETSPRAYGLWTINQERAFYARHEGPRH